MYNRPKLSLIVVKKRISSRFFAMDRGGQFTNPGPGTVIDTEATRPEWSVVVLYPGSHDCCISLFSLVFKTLLINNKLRINIIVIKIIVRVG